jgi:hypothetical protein
MPDPDFSEPSHEHRLDAYTLEGRDALYQAWQRNMITQGIMNQGQIYSAEPRRTFFERWMRDLLQRGYLDAQRPLPTYSVHASQKATN